MFQSWLITFTLGNIILCLLSSSFFFWGGIISYYKREPWKLFTWWKISELQWNGQLHMMPFQFQSTYFPRMSPLYIRNSPCCLELLWCLHILGELLSPTFMLTGWICPPFRAGSNSYHHCLQYFSLWFFWKHNASFGYSFGCTSFN